MENKKLYTIVDEKFPEAISRTKRFLKLLSFAFSALLLLAVAFPKHPLSGSVIFILVLDIIVLSFWVLFHDIGLERNVRLDCLGSYIYLGDFEESSERYFVKSYNPQKEKVLLQGRGGNFLEIGLSELREFSYCSNQNDTKIKEEMTSIDDEGFIETDIRVPEEYFGKDVRVVVYLCERTTDPTDDNNAEGLRQ